jgi:hypothetical protein
MSNEEELAFLRAHLGELSAAVLRHLKWDILAEKKRRGEEKPRRPPKLKSRANDSLPSPVGANPVLLGRRLRPQKDPRATVGKRKANELDSSNSGGSMEPATSRTAPGPLSGAWSARLPAQAKVNPAQGPVVKIHRLHG